MSVLELPLELLLMIAHNLANDDGECCFADLNAFLRVNRVLYSCINPILWRAATERSDATARVFTWLIRRNDLANLKYFLGLGADIETALPYINTTHNELRQPSPLVVATYQNKVPLARLLLENGAKVNYHQPHYSALHAARSVEMVQLLLDHHADPERLDQSRKDRYNGLWSGITSRPFELFGNSTQTPIHPPSPK